MNIKFIKIGQPKRDEMCENIFYCYIMFMFQDLIVFDDMTATTNFDFMCLITEIFHIINSIYSSKLPCFLLSVLFTTVFSVWVKVLTFKTLLE